MGRYDAPADPYEIFGVGCLRVYYPDNPLLFRALRAQLTELENRFLWDTGGDLAAAEKLEQDWLEAGLLTFAAIGDGCPDTGDLNQIIIDLTLQLEQCQNELQEIENMEITVNCNCCCDGDGLPFPNPNTNPVVPLDPVDPFGDTIPEWDDGTQTPPPGYPDTQAWIDDRCRAANWFVDSYIEFVENLDLVERKVSLGTAVLDIVALILAAVPGPVGDWAGVAVIIRWLVKVVSALTEFVEDLEDLGDWLQTSVDAIRDNKQELICAAYNMTTVEYLQAFFTTFFGGYVSPELAAQGYPTETTTLMRALFTPLAEELAKRVADGFANQYIPEDYVASVDCATCPTPTQGHYSLFPVTITNITDLQTSATTQDPHATYVDGVLSVDATGVNIGSNPWYEANVELSAAPTNKHVVGILLTFQNPVNCAVAKFRVVDNSSFNPDAISSSNGKVDVVEGSVGIFVATQSGEYDPTGLDYSSFAADTFVGNGCDPGARGIGLGAVCAANGLSSFEVTGIFWVVDDDIVCP